MTFIKCESCNIPITTEKCVFAVERRVIDGREYIFCCTYCADKYEKKQRKAKK